MFKDVKNCQDVKVYKEYTRLVEILTTDEYIDMYDKIGAIRAIVGRIDELMEDE